MRYTELFNNSLKLLAPIDEKAGDHETRALEIQILFEKAFGLSRTRFWQIKDEPIRDRISLNRFYRYRSRLRRGEPLAYILKEKEFYSIPFFVNRGVLIPRPETEILIQKALPHIDAATTVLDIGGGCGNISITVSLLTGCTVWSCDVCPKALTILKKNIDRHRLKGKVIAGQSDLFPVSPPRFDIILSNPPYLSNQDWESLPPHIKDYEPKKALVGGENGTEALERIIRGAFERLNPDGRLLIEIGYGQAEIVRSFFTRFGYKDLIFHPDYAGIVRVAGGRR